MMPRVSVVIPVFNRPKKVSEAVESVRAQTVSDWEIILVDDGSTDETPQVLKELEKKDPRIHAIFQENKGAQSARNAGIRAAKGEWVAFLDSDDTWLPRSLELRLLAAEQEAVKVVHSGCETIQADGTRGTYSAVLKGDVYKSVLANPAPMFQGMLVAKEALQKIGYLDEKIVAYQEWDTSIRLAKYFKYGFVGQPTFIYDCRGTDTISVQYARNGRGYEQIMKKNFWPMFFAVGLSGLAVHYQRIAEWYEKGKEEVSSRRCRRASRMLKYSDPAAYFRKAGRLTKGLVDKKFRRQTYFMRRLPNFMIIGAQKAGTTSLFEDLMRHPQIKRPLDKELHYFSDSANYRKGLQWYRSQFPIRFAPFGWTEEKKSLTGEATPYYLFHPLAPQRISEVLPRLKMIVLLRNPIDRALSHYFHEATGGRETRSFEQAIENEPAEMKREEARILEDGSYGGLKHRRCSYLSRGIYWVQLERWFKLFARDQFAILKSEDYFREPEKHFNYLVDFLGLPPHHPGTFQRTHVGKYGDPMSPETRDRLREFYRAHNEKLSRLLGRDFNWD